MQIKYKLYFILCKSTLVVVKMIHIASSWTMASSVSMVVMSIPPLVGISIMATEALVV